MDRQRELAVEAASRIAAQIAGVHYQRMLEHPAQDIPDARLLEHLAFGARVFDILLPRVERTIRAQG